MQTAFSLPETIALLLRTPSMMNTFLRGLPGRWVAANEGSDSWSAFDIVGHLIIGERTDWMPRAKRIREHGEAIPFDPFDCFAQEKNAAANLSKSCSMNSLRYARKIWPPSKLSICARRTSRKGYTSTARNRHACSALSPLGRARSHSPSSALPRNALPISRCGRPLDCLPRRHALHRPQRPVRRKQTRAFDSGGLQRCHSHILPQGVDSRNGI